MIYAFQSAAGIARDVERLEAGGRGRSGRGFLR